MTGTTTEAAAEIRAELKRLGWSGRDVSVKASYFSMGSSIDIRIKNPDVPSRKVKAAAEAHQQISRCEMTGEILSGGNQYVSVQYSREAMEVIGARHLLAVNEAAGKLNGAEYGVSIPIAGTPFYLGRMGQFCWEIWSADSFVAQFCSLVDVAQHVGVQLLNLTARA